MKNLHTFVQSLAATAIVAGVIIITTPSDHSLVQFTSGAASHVTSQYSAQINDTVAGPGEHVTVTPAGTQDSQSTGSVATVTVVSQ